jgi:hypothetical protein
MPKRAPKSPAISFLTKPFPVQARFAERKSGRGGLPARSFSPPSFSEVKPPENSPAVNLYRVRIFHAEPGADASDTGYLDEKF